jgi:polysaccharide deacetylase family protein (PEP-CTERM system associated)
MEFLFPESKQPFSVASMLNVLSVDVEDYFHASALKIPADRWEKQEQRASRNTHELLELFGETQTKGTFFVLGWLAERFPDIVRSISSHGHEIACHGYSHKLIYRQTPAEFAEETRRAKHILEDLAGCAVNGYRAASFSIVEDSRWALDIVADLGFTYDSSIFPIRHDRYGMPSANPKPHVLTVPNGKTIVEIPPSVLSLGSTRLPIAGGGYFRLYPYSFTRWAMRRINKQGSPAIVYLHPWEIDTGQPRADVGAVTRFRHYVNIGKVRDRVRRLLSDFSFEPMQSLAQRYSDPAAGGCEEHHAVNRSGAGQ